MIVLSGADLVLPDRILSSGTLAIDLGRIVAVKADAQPPSSSPFAFHGHTIVPGFIDVHVHGISGIDSHDSGNAVARIAQALPRFGVTAFCPTTVACSPDDLRGVLAQVRDCRQTPLPLAARVLPAHLESNFISPAYRGAQPFACLRTPAGSAGAAAVDGERTAAETFTASELLAVIEACAPDIAIVTVAPEIDGGLSLIAWLASLGLRVSLGHSGASFEQALAAIEAGARQATHLFNRMPPLHHRLPGLAAAVLQSDEVAAELICDGMHVHPAFVRIAVAAKTPARVMAVTDGTAASALPAGSSAFLGRRRIVATESCAQLEDGTMAGSVLTMDVGFRRMTHDMGFSAVDAAIMCSTTPARELGLVGHGVIAEGAVADLVVLDGRGEVVQTYVGGQLAYARGVHDGNSPVSPSV